MARGVGLLWFLLRFSQGWKGVTPPTYFFFFFLSLSLLSTSSLSSATRLTLMRTTSLQQFCSEESSFPPAPQFKYCYIKFVTVMLCSIFYHLTEVSSVHSENPRWLQHYQFGPRKGLLPQGFRLPRFSAPLPSTYKLGVLANVNAT